MKTLSIYIHIPFCVKKCNYCDFLSAPANAVTKESYIEALVNEIRNSDYRSCRVTTIFFGGGTPSILDAAVICDILTVIRESFDVVCDAEISIECNPGTVTRDWLKCIRQAGINRLSIGLQSSNDEELARLGRIHTYEQFFDTYNAARECGFKNINIDIMSALPGQSYESYMDTLAKVVALNPEHISSYSLIIEEGTPFFEIYGESGQKYPPLPDEDTEREMYYATKRFLEAEGYHRYEISNYARDGYECRHNTVYWTGDDYLGFGIGAASYVNGVRWKNIDDLRSYISLLSSVTERSNRPGCVENELLKLRVDVEHLTERDRMEEFMIIGLRLMRGVSKSKWTRLFPDTDMNDVFGDVIDKSVSEGLMDIDGDNIRLTNKGIDVSNTVLSRFLAD